MRKVNVLDIDELKWDSPKGRYQGAGKEISEALGRDPNSTDVMKRHPFDVEILRVEPGQTPYISPGQQEVECILAEANAYTFGAARLLRW